MPESTCFSKPSTSTFRNVIDAKTAFLILEDVPEDVVLVGLRIVGGPAAEGAACRALNRDR